MGRFQRLLHLMNPYFFFFCHHSVEIKFTVHGSNAVFLYDLKDFANYFKNLGLLLECDPSTK